MATRTAPAVTAAPNDYLVTLHLIDASGDFITVAVPPDAAATDVQIEAYAAAYQAATQASLYKVSQSFSWSGEPDPDNADALFRGSVKDGINLLYRNAELDALSTRLVAPVPAVMQGNQDIPLLSAQTAIDLITATLALIPGFNLIQAQFTERKERANNPTIRA